MFGCLPCCSNSKIDSTDTEVVAVSKKTTETEAIQSVAVDKVDEASPNTLEAPNALNSTVELVVASEENSQTPKAIRQSGEQNADQVANNTKLAFVT
uniref:Overexpressed in colon carcinoma 1 protein n=1 Tax=Rhabditophanes sp. KR3021 TaxID=114890 RepID=A0AC35TM16_9BILA